MVSDAASTISPRGGNFRRPMSDRLSQPVHDRLGSHQSGPRQKPTPVISVQNRLDRSHKGSGQFHSPRQVYRVKEKKEEVQSTVDSEKVKAVVVVQISNIKVAVNEAGTRPLVLGKLVDTSVQRSIMADEHEARSSNITASKYFQPR